MITRRGQALMMAVMIFAGKVKQVLTATPYMRHVSGPYRNQVIPFRQMPH